MTAVKDGYEDVKRHQSDRRVNHTPYRVLSGGDWINPNATQEKTRTFVRGLVPRSYRARKIKGEGPHPEALHGVTTPNTPPGEPLVEFDDPPPETGHHHTHLFDHPSSDLTKPHWRKTIWEDARVGDFVKIMDNEPIPADTLICSTSEDENMAFVETKNLDGETNLKSRNACPPLTHLRTAADCASKLNTFRIDCGRPDVNLFRLDATVKVGDLAFPVDMQMVLLRGTVLRNTGWVIGVTLYTGEDSRIVMNSGGTPSKRSKVERQMNPQVYVYFLCSRGLWLIVVPPVLSI